MASSKCYLLAIPPEIRTQIYAHLMPESPTPNPLAGIGLTSVSHQLPAAALLNITTQLTDEILEYYYSTAIWKLALRPMPDHRIADNHLDGLERSVILTRLRKLEITYLWDSALVPHLHDAYCSELQHRTDRACEVFLKAEKLRTVIVSWLDVSHHSAGGPPWYHESFILRPFRKLLLAEHPISFFVGRVEGRARGDFMRQMQRFLDPQRQSPMLQTITIEDPAVKSVLRPMTKLWVPQHIDKALIEALI